MTYYILSCDGGGVRGTIIAYILYKYEREMQKTNTKFTIYDKFDMFAGTSTGAVISALYCMFKKSSEQILNYYNVHLFEQIMNKSMIDRIFHNYQFKSKYTEHGKIKVYSDILKDVKFKNTEKQLVIPTYDIQKQCAKIFTSYECNESLKTSDVIQATTAAPSYFPAHKIECANNQNEQKYCSYFIDGGTIANDPALIAYSKAKNYLKSVGKENTEIKILSLGTGYKNDNIDVDKVKNSGGLIWATHGILEVLNDESIITQQLKCLMEPKNYLRINFELQDVSNSFDDTSSENYDKMIKLAKYIWYKYKNLFLNF